MDWVRLHLMLNHFPIILIMTGTLTVIVAALARRRTLWTYAAVAVLLAGITAPASYVTGLESEEIVEEQWWADEEHIEEHEELGLWALITLLGAGATAAVALWKPGRGSRSVFGVVTVAAAVVTGITALEGGEIVHDAEILQTERPPAGFGGAAPEEEAAEGPAAVEREESDEAGPEGDDVGEPPGR